MIASTARVPRITAVTANPDVPESAAGVDGTGAEAVGFGVAALDAAALEAAEPEAAELAERDGAVDPSMVKVIAPVTG